MAHSASTCQWSSRTPPAVSRISTPDMVVEIGNSRTETWRVQPPLNTRLREREKEYLNGFTVPLSLDGDHSESGFSAARGRFCWPGSLSFGAVWAAFCCASAVLLPVIAMMVAARAAEPNPQTSRLLNFASSFSMSAMVSPFRFQNQLKTISHVGKRVIVVFAMRNFIQILACKQMT